MEDTRIKFETAKLAISKGYKEITYHCALLDTYNAHKCNGNQAIKKKMIDCGECGNQRYYSTQSLLQKWLREKHNIHIWVYYSMILESHFYQIRYEVSKNEYQHFTNELDINKLTNTNKFTHEESLELALVKALKLINN